MRYLALACDYDGTLAHDGRVSERTLRALESLLATGRRLLLVTGRELPDVLAIFPQVELFEWVVAENGALLYRPATKEEKVLAAPPPPAFVQTLKARGVKPIAVGRSIVATWQPHEAAVLGAIRDLGLELQVIFNKGAVMVLPTGVSKATGFAAALKEMGLSPHEAVGIGDAENDHAFLSLCECSAAVANALPAVKQTADLVMRGDHGDGVAELIEHVVADDLEAQDASLTRHHLLVGTRADGAEVRLPSYGPGVLICGTSGSGKSTIATSFMERLAEHHYTFCVIDPEGDYEGFEQAVVLGDTNREPTEKQVLELLVKGEENVAVNLVGLGVAERPAFFEALLPKLLELRARTARPHWLVVDETHHLLPAKRQSEREELLANLKRALWITVHPEQVSPAVLAGIGTVIAVGDQPERTLIKASRVMQPTPLEMEPVELDSDQILLWPKYAGEQPDVVRFKPPRGQHRRHQRKYAEGELPPERSFYFRGPDNKLNLRAQNLFFFLQLAEGVDEATWNHHLRNGDITRWFREQLKDEKLATEGNAIEAESNLSAAESRERIRAAVERLYTFPTAAPSQSSAAEGVGM